MINPVTGDRYEFLETAADSGGERVTLLATIHTRGLLVPDHFHVLQDEHFEVKFGELTVKLDGDTRTLQAGQSIELPRGVPHNHYNAQEEPVTYQHSVSPALDFDYFIENLMGLASEGKSKNGNYGFVQQLVTLKYMDSKAFLAGTPVGVQKLLMNTVAPVARLLGYRAVYKRFSGIEK